MKFIYVFDQDAAQKLLDLQFTLLCADEINHKYVFVNNERMELKFQQMDFDYFLSNTLTFHS